MDRRPARHQLLGRVARDEGPAAGPRPVQPLLRAAGARRSRRVDHVEGDGGAGDVHHHRELRGLEEDEAASRRRSPRSRTRTRCRRCLQKKSVVVNAKPLDTGAPWWENLLVGFGPTILFIGLIFFAMRRAGSMQNMLGAFGRSSARQYEPGGDKVTFKDVAGIDEAKEELSEVVDFLRDPEKYRKLGARIPHGVLLSGPPGTGKTLLARAVAGEANVPFFSMAASEFVEAIVGDRRVARARPLHEGEGGGAVDHLHRRARRDRPLAHVGRRRLQRRQRRARADAEPDPHRDGRLRLVDRRDRHRRDEPAGRARPGAPAPGPLRPPRRRAAAGPQRPRGDPARAHAQRPARRPTSTSAGIASTTPGMVGADLANLVNEAALLAARRGHDQVEEADFTDALEKIVLGAERKVMMSKEDKRRTAYHEGGHAIVGMLTPGADPVRKISIIPRGLALGVTFSAPDADRYNYSRDELDGEDQGRARRPLRRGGRLRRPDDRRRVRLPAADADRAADGRPLGDETRRSGRSPSSRRTGKARCFPAPPASRRRRSR